MALCPFHDDAALGADPRRNNDFLFEADDPVGFKTPGGSHIRRCNPRDAAIAGVARIHRMIRRGTAYGPTLPDGVMVEDGADRGLMFAFVGAHLGRQFEFVQSQWINDGVFFGADDAPQLQQMKHRFVAKYDADGKKAMELRRQWWEQGTNEGWIFLFYHDVKTPVTINR